MITFRKKEHLCGKMLINQLFTKGNHFFIYPFKLLWLNNNDITSAVSAQLLISVPKKNITSAVDRNKIKRRIKEAYRKNKSAYYNYLLANDKKNILAFIYTEKKIIPYKEIEEKIILILQHLQKENEKNYC